MRSLKEAAFLIPENWHPTFVAFIVFICGHMKQGDVGSPESKSSSSASHGGRFVWRSMEFAEMFWKFWRSSGRTHRNWCALIFEAALGPKLTCFVALKVCEAFINSKVSIDAKDTDSWPCGDVYLFLDHLFVAPGNEQICPGFCIWSALGFFQGCWAKAAGNFLK